MGFQDRAYQTQLARSAWLFDLGDHCRERDAEFADQLRMKAWQLRKAEHSAVSCAKRDAF